MNHKQTDDSTDTERTTDGGMDRRGALKALGGLAALGAVPGAVTAEKTDESDDGRELTDETDDKPEIADEQLQRTADLRFSVPTQRVRPAAK